MSNRFESGLCVLLWIGLMVIGLWPFNLFPRNRVSWLSDRPGISFDWEAIALTEEPLVLAGSSSQPPAVTIELWLKPARKTFDHYADIFSLYRPDRSDSFAIGQMGSILHVNGSFHSPFGPSLNRGFAVAHIFQPDQSQFVTLVLAASGTRVYSQGELAGDYPGITPLPAVLTGQLVLGHSATRYHPWAGQMLRLAIFNRALSQQQVKQDYQTVMQGSFSALAATSGIVLLYPFQEGQGTRVHNQVGNGPDLFIPARFQPLRRIFLEAPSKVQYQNKGDVVINILGFIPLGFLLAGYFRAIHSSSTFRSTLLAILLGAATSLIIESLQGYLPTRTSSFTDLINNTGGSLIGAVVRAVTKDVTWRIR